MRKVAQLFEDVLAGKGVSTFIVLFVALHIHHATTYVRRPSASYSISLLWARLLRLSMNIEWNP